MAEVMNRLIMQFSQIPKILSLFSPNILLSTLLSITLCIQVRLQVKK
jgi:hypothetical protein